MKKLLAILVCSAMVLATTSCGGNDKKAPEDIARISPDTIITMDNVATVVGGGMSISDEGIVSEGKTQSVTYVSEPIGTYDPVTVSIEQFSESLSSSEVWADYENDRLRRPDAEFITGVGTDCYIAYPYINVYDRGCYIRISAGSGGGEEQKNTLINLAVSAVNAIQQKIPAEAAEAAANDVIR